jgi:hypothetical protein
VQAARAEVAEGNTNGPEKMSALAEGHEVMKAWKNDGVVVTAQVILPVPMKQMSGKSRGAEEGVFVCLGRAVLTRQIDESVMLSKTEAVEKVEGWEASGSGLVMTAILRLKVEVAVEVAVTMVVAVVVERLEEAAAAAGKAVMAELEALKEEGRTSLGKVVVGILDAEVKGEDAGAVLSGGAEVASHLTKAAAAAGDCPTVAVQAEGCRMVGVEGVVWRMVVGAGVLRVGEVGARDLSSKTLEFWDRGVQAVQLSKSSMTSPKKRPSH